MSATSGFEPVVGEWYSNRSELFEVVAVDDGSGTIEIQYADGSLAELDEEDWRRDRQAGALRAEQPENSRASVDTDDLDEDYRASRPAYDEERSWRASGLEGLDLFD